MHVVQWAFEMHLCQTKREREYNKKRTRYQTKMSPIKEGKNLAIGRSELPEEEDRVMEEE